MVRPHTTLIQAAVQAAATTVQVEGRLCPLCQQPLGEHPYDICADCFDNKRPNCPKCGKRPVLFNRNTRKWYGQCPDCYDDWLGRRNNTVKPAAPAAPSTPALPTANVSPEMVHMWSRLARAKQTVEKYRVPDPEATPTLQAIFEQAETACDEEDLATCNQMLNKFWHEKAGFDLAHRLGDQAYMELEGWTFWLWDAALIAYNVQQYPYGHEILVELEGILDYEDQQAAEVERADREIDEIIRQVIKSIVSRKELEATRARMRELREAFMQQQTPPTPAPRPSPTVERQQLLPAPKARTREEQPCRKCGKMTINPFCYDCHQSLPDCPNECGRKVHVDRNGRNMPNCFPCYRRAEEAREIEHEIEQFERSNTPKVPDPELAARKAARRARQLARSGNNKGPIGRK